MTTTLRRELITAVEETLEENGIYDRIDIVTKIVDRVLEIRAIASANENLESRQAKLRDFLEKSNPEFAVLSGAEVKQADQEERIVSDEALASFERELHFNPLPWDSSKEWERFKKFVVSEYKKDRNVWRRYDEWRKGHGKFSGAMNNKNIRYRPIDFVDCFPDFLASCSMYGNKNNKNSTTKNEVDDNDIPVTY